MKKVKIIDGKCIGCGACIVTAEKIFEYDGAFSKVKKEEIDDNELNEVIEAKQGCPVDAIEIIDEDENNKK